ncbi:FecR family protein [Gaoshiqia sp. Z1-71]|uniref:FecR family protein n=1 Tax=Gaoshiqia hydrogeniformans TaxID=3290090 RepID=UPI003BF782B9
MKLKAEDFLSRDGDVENNFHGEATQEDIRSAKEILAFLKQPKHKMPANDQVVLKNQIRASMVRARRRKLMLKWTSVAAVLFVAVMGINIYHRYLRFADIESYANSLAVDSSDSVTRLLLNNGTEVHIQEIESAIKYDNKGEQIEIGRDQRVEQKLEPVKPIYNSVFVPYGRRAFLTLSEGTKVWLNSGSKLVYPAKFASNNREVFIDGEAIFDVAHVSDIPFVVKTSYFDVNVLGTVFNVSAYSDDSRSSTVLQTGKIELCYKQESKPKKDRMDMNPGDMVIYDQKSELFNMKIVNPDDYLSWRNGYYVFRSDELEHIMKKISRYYNIEISIKNRALAKEKFSGSLDLKSSAEEVIKTIARTTQLNYLKENGKIMIITD